MMNCARQKNYLLLLLCLLIKTTTSALEISPGVFMPPQIFHHPEQPQNNSQRPPSTPYISGDTFRSVANFFVDEMGLPIDIRDIKDGDIIIVVTEHLDYFFTELHPNIVSSYILITNNSDIPAPGKYADRLNDEKIIAWFTQNADLENNPKLIPIPIGIANPYWGHGNFHLLNSLISHSRTIPKDKVLYLNVGRHTNALVRDEVVQLFSDKSFCYNASSRPWPEYLMDLARSKFVLSPRGNGLDCHRTWEALLMGSIPVVKSSTIDILYQDLPVLIVHEWSEITQEFLEEKYAEMSAKTYKMENMYVQYWLDKIKNCQKNFLLSLNNDK